MTTRLSRSTRVGRTLAPLAVVAVAVALLWSPAPVGAAPGTTTDPDDVSLRLDVKAASHANEGSTITYTVETYENFPDDHADFKWLIDKNGDGAFDLIVTTEYADGDLEAGVDDARERAVGDASVTRPAGNAIRVSFPTALLGGATSYSYRVSAISDLNGNGETDPGEEDLAPNTGWFQHSLASGTPSPVVPATTPTPVSPPSPSAAAPGPGSSSPVASSPVTSSPVRSSPAAGTPGRPASPSSPSSAAPSVAGATTSRAPSDPSAAPAEGASSSLLARTGRAHGPLARFGTGITLAGIGLLAIGSRRRQRQPVPVNRTT